MDPIFVSDRQNAVGDENKLRLYNFKYCTQCWLCTLIIGTETIILFII